MTDEKVFVGRLFDLAEKSRRAGVFTYTPFMGLSEQHAFIRIKNDPRLNPFVLFGGNEQCERVMARFGSEEQTGYSEPFPISLIHIVPLNDKFSDKLTHRDFLGAILSLGIERDQIGDIIAREREGYVFCAETLSGYICDNLTSVKRTFIRCEKAAALPQGPLYMTEPLRIVVSSERADGIVSRVFNLSRSESERLFTDQRVYVNGAPARGKDVLHENDVVSCRGLGRFRYKSERRETKKGRLSVTAEKYI